ncbi:HpcH/HpaI aldolase/citrate lyase family protein [Haloplasma contractile]|uniref:Citryl-CoA lyase protein n=1 Tax=Haloplasma contractile SSD-17B TaxID=1033810 RepID=U2FSD1_9MOLU|nr:CoA ester lyase [Haloplasma contractile]ERJ13849.1 citryl-CoA lyase protein [Haloplasma contractile SSD-17B]
MSKIRRSMLFIPGNTPGMLQSADVFDADSIIIDLEDSVSVDEKDSARILLEQLLSKVQFTDVEVIVRMNPFESTDYEKDIEVLQSLDIDLILLPKAEQDSVSDLTKRLESFKYKTDVMILVETALGVEQVFDLLNTSVKVKGLMLGGEDLCVDLNCERTKTGEELLYARTRVVNAARALKKFVIDTPFTDTNDDIGLTNDTRFAKKIGFDGKASINPRQIETINKVFTPKEDEINDAKRVIEAKDQALKEGKGVFSLDGKMVDLPIIKRAERIMAVASKTGLLKEGEHNEN